MNVLTGTPLLPTYARFPVTFVDGEGSWLIADDGQRYLDLVSGIAVVSLGHCHPAPLEAAKAQLERLWHVSNLYSTEPMENLARLLSERFGGAHAFFCNSGTEAVEAAIKISRAATGRPRVLYAEHAFHGLTLGSLSINGNAEFRDGFGPLLDGCDPVGFGDIDALERELARGDVAAFVVEPVQGKGVNLPAADYLPGAQRLCRAAGAMFVCDEVQTGIGRTGRFLALEHWDLQPDLICLAKALSGGLVPIGATLVSRWAFDRVFDGMERAVRHGSTFGGNDLAAAAALATLGVLDREGHDARSERMCELLLELTRPLVDRYEVVTDVRGLGLMWAIEFGPPSGAVALRLWDAVETRQPGLFSQLITVPLFHDHHILCQVAGHHMNVIKALPALTIEESEIRRFAAALEETIAAAERYPSALARFGLRTGSRAARIRR